MVAITQIFNIKIIYFSLELKISFDIDVD